MQLAATVVPDLAARRRNAFVFIVTFFAVWIGRAFIYRYVDMSITAKWLATLSSLGWKTVVWIGMPVAYLARVEKAGPLDYLKLRVFDGRIARWCLGMVAVGIIWQLGLWLLGLDRHFPGPLTIAQLTWGAGVCEEILFRGFLLRLCSEIMSFVPAMLLTSLLFVGAHVPGWLIFMGYTWQHVLSSGAYVFGFAIVVSLLYKKSASLYPSIVFHSINDVISL